MKQVLALTAVALLLVIAACTTSDTTRPAVTIVAPANGASLDTGTVIIKAVATDNEKVVKVEFYDGAAKIGEDGTGKADTFDLSWTATAGAHTLKAVAWDGADNTAEHAISVTVTPGGGGGTGPTYHEDDITGGDTIWYPSGNPHIVKNTIRIEESGKLIVMPGCVVKFNTNAYFRVGLGNSPGEIQAVGKADSVIVFTSNATTPNPGDWWGFDLYDGTRTSTKFSYCEISYGGWENYGLFSLTNVNTIAVDHTTIRQAPTYGIWLGKAGSYITGFAGNTITGCLDYPIYATPENLHRLTGGNTLTGNTRDGILVSSGTVAASGTWQNQGVPYVIGGNLRIESATGANLTIGKGSVVKIASGVNISIGQYEPGGLKADSVTFTSAAATPQRGDYYGIWFWEKATDAECRLTNCRIQYGGGDNYGNIWLRDAVPTITGCHIAHSKGWGIYLDGSEYPDPSALEANNTFENNILGNVRRP